MLKPLFIFGISAWIIFKFLDFGVLKKFRYNNSFYFWRVELLLTIFKSFLDNLHRWRLSCLQIKAICFHGELIASTLRLKFSVFKVFSFRFFVFSSCWSLLNDFRKFYTDDLRWRFVNFLFKFQRFLSV